MSAKRKTKPKQKYPFLLGCYVDEGFSREYHRKFLQGRVAIEHYKGAMLLSIREEKPCECHRPIEIQAWLKGDDLDVVIAMLREAKKVWLRAYRKAAREVRQSVMERKLGNLRR